LLRRFVLGCGLVEKGESTRQPFAPPSSRQPDPMIRIEVKNTYLFTVFGDR
jgi:hypothetical protein